MKLKTMACVTLSTYLSYCNLNPRGREVSGIKSLCPGFTVCSEPLYPRVGESGTEK